MCDIIINIENMKLEIIKYGEFQSRDFYTLKLIIKRNGNRKILCPREFSIYMAIS